MNADHDKTTATTEAESSHPEEAKHWSPKCRRNTSCAGKNQWQTEKKVAKL